MTRFRLPLLLSMTLAGSAGWTQTLPEGPIADLQTQVIGLADRVAALENAAPSASVEGRSYCFVLDLTMMQGIGANETERVSTSIIRRTATFNGGTLEATLLSHVRNTQDDDGIVTPSIEDSPDPLLATYTQSGHRLDLIFSNGSTANWYVSKDGSLISGTSIAFLGPLPGPAAITIGQTRHWTLVENDSCDVEAM